jgi:hypothetical protein
MLSMPTGIDYGVNEAALLAVARDAFAEHDQIWMAGQYEGRSPSCCQHWMRSADSYRQGWPVFAVYACEMDARGGLPKRHVKFCIEVPEDALSRYGNPPTLPWLRHVFADGGYAGQKLRGAIACDGDGTIGIIKRSDAAKGLEILPRDGSSSSPSHGSSDAAAWRKNEKRPSLPQPDGRWSRLAACSPEEPQDTAMLDKLWIGLSYV